MAVRSNPAASAGVEGQTTFSPGMCMNRLSRDWEWVAALPRPVPCWPRITRGILAWPPNTYRVLATWLKIWSAATKAKSQYISSAMGRIPPEAAPRAAPMMADSEMGVLRTRSVPNSL